MWPGPCRGKLTHQAGLGVDSGKGAIGEGSDAGKGTGHGPARPQGLCSAKPSPHRPCLCSPSASLAMGLDVTFRPPAGSGSLPLWSSSTGLGQPATKQVHALPVEVRAVLVSLGGDSGLGTLPFPPSVPS